MKRASSGYTLIEALVASIILIIALPLLTRWVLAGRQAQVGSVRSDLATASAVRAMDSLSQLPRSLRPTSPSDSVSTTLANGASAVIVWRYLQSSPFSPPLPGAAYVEIHWKAGSANRTTRLEGVLP